VKHPCIVQLRGIRPEKLELVGKFASRTKAEIELHEKGIDIYFEDVNEARTFISRLKKLMNFRVKMSTKYAGIRGSRVRVLFVYSLRCSNENSE